MQCKAEQSMRSLDGVCVLDLYYSIDSIYFYLFIMKIVLEAHEQ